MMCFAALLTEHRRVEVKLEKCTLERKEFVTRIAIIDFPDSMWARGGLVVAASYLDS